MIRWDAMHIVNLGVDLWICGSVMRKLLQYEVWGGSTMDEADRLLVAYDIFKTWSRVNKVQCFSTYNTTLSHPKASNLCLIFKHINGSLNYTIGRVWI